MLRANVLHEKKWGLAILRTKLDALLAKKESPSGCASLSVRAASFRKKFSLEKNGYANHGDGKRD
ncbi:hypothetical protein MPNT_50111 [Candidatus Methylacidithermus pantelleriae]|uniref:Uncharacterized protein n=1 Tax=Candidatus Methylacidithermus pantelleriae TaxID=2744239 RepID=A0A8J2FT45_9BACT|nr:hypothetical protein MPNT_50111 [Candidatus Methylacidithermus pantelleriae]